MVRGESGSDDLLHNGGKLFQQYVVDVYCRVDWMRLRWYTNNQDRFRAEKLSGLMDYVRRRRGGWRPEAGNGAGDYLANDPHGLAP